MGKDDSTREMYLTLSLPGSAPGVILKQYARSQGDLSLGRAAKSDSSAAALDTPKFRNDKTRVMSNKHARLAWNGNTPTITDVGSTNGVRIRQVDDPTSLYECKVGVAYRINSGDTIVFGKPIQDPDQSGEVMCQPLEVVANVNPTPMVPLSKTKLTQAGRPDSAPLERVPTIGYSRRGPLIHGFVKETVEQPQTQSDRRRAPLSTLIKERYIQQPSSQPESRPRPLSTFLSNAAVEAKRAALQQQQELKLDRPLPPLANLADPGPDYLKPHSRSTGFGLTDTDVCVSFDNTDDEAERKPAFVGSSRRHSEDERLPVSGNVDPLAKPLETSLMKAFSLPEKGAVQQAVADEDDTEMPIKTTPEDKPNVAEVENAPLTAFQRMVIEGLERRTPPPGPLDPSSPRQMEDAPAAVEVARKVTVWEVASQASHLPSPVSSDHEAEAREEEKHLDHDAEADQANDLAIDMYLDALLELDNLSSESRGRALHPSDQRDQSTSSKVERDIGGEVVTGQGGAEILLSPAPEPLVVAEIASREPSVFLRPVDAAEQDQAEPDLQAEEIDLAPIPVPTQDEKDRLVSRWRAGLDQAVGEGDGPSQERLQEDTNVRALDATQEERDKLIARRHAELAQVNDGDSDQLAGESGEESEAAAGLDEYDRIVKGSRQPDAEEDDAVFDLDEYDRLARNKQGARSDQGSDIVDDSACMDEEAHDYAEAADEAELPIAGAAKERSSSPAEEALYEDEGSDARPSAHDSEAEVENEVEEDEEDEVEEDEVEEDEVEEDEVEEDEVEEDEVEEDEVEVDEEDHAEVDVDSEAEVEHEIEEDEDDEFEVEVEDAFEVDEEEDFEVDDEEEFEVDGQERFEVDAEGDFFDAVDSSYSDHDQQDGDGAQQPFEEARALLDAIDQKEPRLAAVLLRVMKDFAENPINLDDMYDDDDASVSDARSASSRVDDDDEEQDEAGVDENSSAYSEWSDRVDQSREDGEEDRQEEVGDQSSYDGGDFAGDDYDSEEDLPEKANSASDASELDPESPLRLRKRRFSDVDSDGLTDWLERENNAAAAQEGDASNENHVESLAPADQGNPKRRRLSLPFKSFAIGVLTGVVGAVAGLTACDSLLGPA